jgi:prepilin-type N-terminal cleavage/methylation domain-containing protein
MRNRRTQSGFTLIELLIVMTIISILALIAIPSFTAAVQHAREAVLREDLQTMRMAIDSYTMDKQKAPQSLDDLVQEGYLKAIPEDPMTHAKKPGSPTPATPCTPSTRPTPASTMSTLVPKGQVPTASPTPLGKFRGED